MDSDNVKQGFPANTPIETDQGRIRQSNHTR